MLSESFQFSTNLLLGHLVNYPQRAAHDHFVRLKSDQTPYHTYLPDRESTIITHIQDLHTYSTDHLLGVSSFINGLSSQIVLEHAQNLNDGGLDEVFTQNISIYRVTLTQICA